MHDAHGSNAESHRGRNGHPTISRSSRGGAPGIEITSSSPSRSGVAANSIRVYGCRGSWKIVRRPAHLDDLARVHDGGPVAHLCDDGQVVRDEDQRQAELLRVWLSFTSSSSTCACTITSSAVVGSSASSTFG